MVIFSLMVFILSYNLETSLRIVGMNPAELTSSYLGASFILLIVLLDKVMYGPGHRGCNPRPWLRT